MKKWNTPEVAELNINETANGFFDCTEEFCIFINDDKKDPNPVTPDEES